jgi:hypothetical protein
MDNRQNLRDWLAISLSVASIGVGLSAPIFLFPCALVSTGINVWVLRRQKGLPRKSDLAAIKHREKWRQGLEVEFSEKSGELIATVQQREALIQNQAIKLTSRQEELIDWEKQLVTAEGRLTNALREQEQYYLELIDRIEEGMRAELNLRENAILNLQQKLMGLVNRPDPKQGFAAWIAQLLLQALEQNEVFCQLKGFYKPPGIREVSVWIELAPTTPARKLESISKEVGSMVKFGEPTILWDADECVYEFQFSPEVDSYETSYEVVIDNESELPEIQEPEDKNWFVNVVLDSKSVHYMIHGPSGLGKSVLTDNIICVAGDDLATATNKKLRIFICDPKFPDSEWTYRGERLKPQYRRWEGAVEGVLAMQQEVNQRLDDAAAAAESVPLHLFKDPNYLLPLPNRDIDFWVVDEAAALYMNYPKQCEIAYKSTLWVGRSSLVKAILVGQNPNASNYGLQIPDLSNCVRFYIGITALEALDRYVKPPREIKAKLKAQIYARLLRVKQQKMLGIAEPVEQYFAMVVKSNEPPFIAQLPSPKAYANNNSVAVEATLGEVEQEDIESLVEKAKLNQLDQNLKDVVEYARQKETWIDASSLRQNRNRFKTTQSAVIATWFETLEAQGIGECSKEGKAIKYRYPSQE